MNPYRLHGRPGWGSAIVEAQLAWLGLAFDDVEVGDLFESEDARRRLRGLNPVAQVPTLELPDGSVLTESAAITLHLADATGRKFAGMDLNERAALVAADAGIHHCYFKGSRLPDFAGMTRLRERGAFTLGILGGPRLFASVPNAGVIVVIDACTIADADLLRAAVRKSMAESGRASLV